MYPKEVADWESAPGPQSNFRFDWTWGFLFDAGYPIVIGETSWKTEEGKAWVKNALLSYMCQRGMGTSNIFVWGIGYLGDTQTLIDPTTGMLNVDMTKTLIPYLNLP